MKQIIFLFITFSFLSFFINNQEVLAAGPPPPPKAPPPKGSPPGPNAITSKDPRLQAEKYCISKCAPTVVPVKPFDVKRDIKDLYVAMGYAETNEKVINDILSNRGNAQRQEIAEAYNTEFKKDMIRKMGRETSGSYEAVLRALLIPLPSYFAKELHNNIGKKGTDELMMVENLCSLSNYGIKSMAELYQTMYGKPLAGDVKAETSGSLQKVMMSSVEGKRIENQKVDNAKATADAQTLFKTKGQKWLADNSEFNTILGTRSYEQLKQIFIEYKKISKQEIDVDIKTEFKGKVGDGLLAFVKCARSKAAFIAERLHHSMKGLGTKEATLTRVIVSRCEIDLEEIKAAFQTIYGKSLEKSVEGDTSGEYRDILLALIRTKPPPKK